MSVEEFCPRPAEESVMRFWNPFKMVCFGILAKSNFDFFSFCNNRIVLVLFSSLPHLFRAYYYKAVFNKPLETICVCRFIAVLGIS